MKEGIDLLELANSDASTEEIHVELKGGQITNYNPLEVVQISNQDDEYGISPDMLEKAYQEVFSN